VHYVLNKPYKLRLLTLLLLLKLSSLQENVGIVHKSLVVQVHGLSWHSKFLLQKIEKSVDLLSKFLLLVVPNFMVLLLPLEVLS